MTMTARARLHPELYHPDPGHLGALALTEVAEQIYSFQLFSPHFCRLLIEEAEHQGRWRHAPRGHHEANPYAPTQEYWEPDTIQHLDAMPGLDAVWSTLARGHLAPLIESRWTTFRLKQLSRPYILRYRPTEIAAMALHHDLETVTLVGYLNDDFDGGGTHFPRWRYRTTGAAPGSAILYPGGLSHEHEALPITRGTRYVFCASFF